MVGGEVLQVNKTGLDEGAYVISAESPSSPLVRQTGTTQAPCTPCKETSKDEDLLREAIELLQVKTIKNLHKEIQDLKKERNQKEEQKQGLQQTKTEQTALIERLRRENIEEITKIRKEYEDNLQRTIQDSEKNMTRIAQENEDNIQMTKQRNTRNEIVLQNKLSDQTIVTSYMMNVLLKSEEMRKSTQGVIEAQAYEMSETLARYEECQNTNKANLKITFESQEIIRKQTENVARLQKIVKMDKNLTRSYGKIEKNDPYENNCDLTAWMTHLTEAYRDQQGKIDDLTSFLEENKEIEEHLNNLKTDIVNLRNDETDILKISTDDKFMFTRYEGLIVKQSESISLLRAIMSYTVNSTSALRYEETEDGTLLSASTCACIPDPPTSGLTPAQITYECAEARHKSYNLNCVKGTCTNEDWPECDEEITEMVINDVRADHEEVIWQFFNCHEVFIMYLNKTVNCGMGGSKVGLMNKIVGQGVFNQKVSVPCMECGEETFEWSSWSTVDKKSIRRRGSSKVGHSYQEEERPMPGCKKGWTQYETACYKLLTGEATRESYRSICRTQGGDLASAHSREENNFLTTLLRINPISTYTWIGGYGCVKGGGCKWLDGSGWDWDNWGSGEPTGDSNCVYMGWKDHEKNEWFVVNCDHNDRSGTEGDGICKMILFN
eukprot:GFUD01018439.1.p1 GENE.GFUD01018439.1~~GFUD01018439.1.p1  ORF type:complete len:695 (-),score=178.49 GFUD01018439.1:95-2092(-)